MLHGTYRIDFIACCFKPFHRQQRQDGNKTATKGLNKKKGLSQYPAKSLYLLVSRVGIEPTTT
jgi:hypothetical protein